MITLKFAAIDPGPHQSAATPWEVHYQQPVSLGSFLLPTEEFIDKLDSILPDIQLLVIEAVINYGHPLDLNARNTILNSGRFHQLSKMRKCPVIYVPYSDVGVHFCKQRHAKQSAINVALVAKFGYGNVIEAKGSKKNPAIFYGVESHIWSSAALAMYISENINEFGMSFLDKYKI